MAKINEIFESVQGEGLYVGAKQLFIRFCGCNLSCAYCDTDYTSGVDYTPIELFNKIVSEYNLGNFHSISLTGGEPLLDVDFMDEFLMLYKNSNQKPIIYLETNATLTNNFLKIKDKVNIVSADIKLKSSTGLDCYEMNKRFIENCKGIETFAKVVFDERITDGEIEKCIILGKTNDITLILQPKMNGNKMSVSGEFCYKIFEKFIEKYDNVRLIPQVHKFLNLR